MPSLTVIYRGGEKMDTLTVSARPAARGRRSAIIEPDGSGGEVKRERTREQILEAARTALVEVGFEHITTRCIAEVAGVNIATLHYYFGTKEALLAEAVQYTLSRSTERIRAAIDTAPTTATALDRAFQTIWEMVRERPGVLRFDLVVRGMRDAQAHGQVTTIYDALHDLMRELLERHIANGQALAPGSSVPILTHFLVSAVDGVILQHLIYNDTEKTIGTLNLILRQAKSLLRVEQDSMIHDPIQAAKQ